MQMKRKLELYIDIGNTNASFAVYDGKKLKNSFSLRTAGDMPVRHFLLKNLKGTAKSVTKVMVVSVVPPVEHSVKKALRAVFPGSKIIMVGRDVHVPMRINYKKPKEVGQDRLVTAYAALKLYGAPALIMDFGTAVTFDIVSPKGDYEGGLIFPGLRLALESLVKNTALLPKIEIKAEKGMIGRDTRSSMNKGIVLGYADLCDGMIDRFRRKYGKKLKIVATGGDAALISKYTKNAITVCPQLIFKGMIRLG